MKTWQQAIREAHRQWAKRLAAGGAIIGTRNATWATYWVPYSFNRKRFYWRGL
jgi:hypothetical protein